MRKTQNNTRPPHKYAVSGIVIFPEFNLISGRNIGINETKSGFNDLSVDKKHCSKKREDGKIKDFIGKNGTVDSLM